MTRGKRSVWTAAFATFLLLGACSSRTGLTDKTGSLSPADSGAPPAGDPDAALAGNQWDAPGIDLAPWPPGGAILTVNQPAVDFGVLDVGVASAAQSVVVLNAGTAPSGPLVVTTTGTGITTTGCAGEILVPQASCQITITALEQAPGPVTGTVRVSDNPANVKSINVTGEVGTPGRMWASIFPSPLDLGSVPQGKTVTGTVVLSNTGLATGTGIVISASGSGFVIGENGTCADTLAGGTSCTIEVEFTAGTTAGPAKGIVTVTFGGATKSVAVYATVVSTEPSLIMDPPSASFQTVVGTPSLPFTFNVRGDVSSGPLTVTITGANKDDFSFKSTCPSTVGGGTTDTCQVTVVYTPKAAMTVGSTATLTVSGSGMGASAAATLLGTTTSSTGPVNPVDLIPVDNTVSGWIVDAAFNASGSKKPMIASTKEEGGTLIDGGIEPYYADGFSPKQFIWQNYSNSHLPAAPADPLNPQGAILSLYLFRMPSANQASGLYQNLLKYSEYTRRRTASSNGWEEPTAPLVGSRSRMQDTGASWWINFQKDEYYVEISLNPSNGPAPDFAPGNPDLKKEALRFAQMVAQKL